MTAFLDVHLKQIAQVVQARAALAEQALLLDAGRLGVALRDDEPPQLIAELARHFLPDRLAEEIAEADRRSCTGSARKMPQRYSGSLTYSKCAHPSGSTLIAVRT